MAPQVNDRTQEAAEKSTVSNEPTAPEREDLEKRFELAGIGHVVEHPRHHHCRHGGKDVAVGERLFRELVSVGEAERQVPTYHQREPEHHAVAVDGNRRKVAEPFPPWQGNANQDRMHGIILTFEQGQGPAGRVVVETGAMRTWKVGALDW